MQTWFGCNTFQKVGLIYKRKLNKMFRLDNSLSRLNRRHSFVCAHEYLWLRNQFILPYKTLQCNFVYLRFATICADTQNITAVLNLSHFLIHLPGFIVAHWLPYILHQANTFLERVSRIMCHLIRYQVWNDDTFHQTVFDIVTNTFNAIKI